jgi:hypothetical protein
LELINNHDKERVSKKKLKDIAIENRLIHGSSDESKMEDYSEQAGFVALNKTLIELLKSWRFITVEKVGSHQAVSLSDEGRDTLRYLKV